MSIQMNSDEMHSDTIATIRLEKYNLKSGKYEPLREKKNGMCAQRRLRRGGSYNFR